jgi:hypothetical protein
LKRLGIPQLDRTIPARRNDKRTVGRKLNPVDITLVTGDRFDNTSLLAVPEVKASL